MAVVHQGPCPMEGCGSSDAFTIFDDGGYTCFSCHGTQLPEGYDLSNFEEVPMQTSQKSSGAGTSLWKSGKKEAFLERGITKETVERFQARLIREDTGEPSSYLLPYTNNEGELKAFKMKAVDKTSGGTPYSWPLGNKGTVLFGQNLWAKGGKYITITEGELDAMAAWQMLRNSKVPDPVVVSLKNGVGSSGGGTKYNQATGKREPNNGDFADPSVYDYVDSFENIIICTDGDEPGRAAAENLVKIFGAKKTKIVKHLQGAKDANDYLLQGKIEDFRRRWWQAEEHRPRSVLTFSEAWERAVKQGEEKCYPLPWKGLNAKTYGCRMREMWTWTAQEKIGKTQIMRELCHHFYHTTDYPMAFMSLEEVPAKSAKGLLSTFTGIPLHLPDLVYDQAEVDAKAAELIEADRIFYFDGFMSSDLDDILSKVQYFTQVLGCKFIFLDHISAIVSDQSFSDERKALDEIATKLKNSTVDFNYNLHMVSHLNRDNLIRGTANIDKLSDMVINMERDKEADDPILANTTCITVKNNRFSGDHGVATHLYYDKATTRMHETSPPTPE